MYYVYILLSTKDRQLYIGLTNDLKRRYKEHSEQKVPATRYRLPLQLIYYEAYIDFRDAKKREKFLKGGNGRGQLKIQIQNTLKQKRYKHLTKLP